jgi:hypothetical protein
LLDYQRVISPSVSTTYIALSLSSPALPPYKDKDFRPQFQAKPGLYFTYFENKVGKRLGNTE